MDYEVVIVAAPKDYTKVKYAVASINQYLQPQPKCIHVITPANGCDSFNGLNIVWHDEMDVLPLNPRLSRFKRPLWVYQQFLKLGQNVTSTNYYLVFDSDLILLKPIKVFTINGYPQFFLGHDLVHEPDYATMRKLYGIGREYPYSFISEMMMMNKNITAEIADDYGGITGLYSEVCKTIDHEGADYRFSEYQLYGNYVYKYHTLLYEFRNFNVKMYASFAVWTDEQIRQLAKEAIAGDFEALTYHTWVEND